MVNTQTQTHPVPRSKNTPEGKAPGGKTPLPDGSAPTAPHLPASFYGELLDLPRCKTDGYCDGCGKCEH